MQHHQVSNYEIPADRAPGVCVNMLPKTWRELLDSLTLESNSIGTLNKISSTKLQEDIADICINEKGYKYVMLTN
jgi:hypothetical protein